MNIKEERDLRDKVINTLTYMRHVYDSCPEKRDMIRLAARNIMNRNIMLDEDKRIHWFDYIEQEELALGLAE